jgi:4-aminobutyrate aminotransferase / (S)-3-amino-2-methylpropionate transaminase
MPIAPPGMS